ncbi:PQQ-dependent dehydrogenase, methanol/ethanol family [Novosphingobium mangrovi (ex Huang et al. 2023)]|uniref:PQQ-dependent dehydrogenase, methanol/ethanol family n=1 Tax=Novosphingobium mangrovi (ex Huang et al. 2023) TaxID=2976432 RepID=A0ABT2I8Z9_9SPHN|nr:PQQ-dependent dehydrogenase, methanol/ethanol family [Novosphingobium mangrovi (ex Huang et al. 2023)]MCT2401068.1 PQQ-dependent dehydrogenase, methanol/ethanol family [Novosphingobium mangrovi (ex Huang et al. 2023)]
MRRKVLPLMAATALALTGVLPGCSGMNGGSGSTDAATGAGDDWKAVGGGFDETSYSRLDQVSTGNIGKLGLAWSLDLPGEVTLEATPIEVDGTIYFTGSYAKVYAVGAKTGAIRWTYDPETWKHDPLAMHFSFGANRGVAYENGRIYAASLDGRLFALNARTGKELWVTETVPQGVNAIVTGAPTVMNGKVIIGNGGADFGTRGFVTAYDGATGKPLWRFYIVPGSPEQNEGDPAMEAAAGTWEDGFWKKTGGGGGPWNAMTFDPEFDRVYIGTGNAAPYDQEARGPGGNLYTASIVALDAGTGKYVWHYQPVPGDSWDYDNTSQMALADLEIDGKSRKVLMQAPKNGFFYVIDRETGKLLNEPGKTTKITWASRVDPRTGIPEVSPEAHYATGASIVWPGGVGGHDWQSMSYSPRTGLVYIPVQQIAQRFSREGGPEDAFDVMGVSVSALRRDPDDGHGYLVAWDPVAQKEVWRVRHKGLWNGGTLATAGGLVFQGTATGYLKAYDGKSGKELWKFNAGLGIVGAPMSYKLDGTQYISVLVGYGGTTAAYGQLMDMGYKFGKQPRRLLTFAIGGDKALPPSPPPDFTVHALDDPALKLDEADVAAGRALSVQCAACHGVGLHATGTPGPDLRESAIALDLGSFRELLHSGSLMELGMPRFENLTDTQIRQIHAYIRARAREALGKREKDDRAPSAKL